MKSLFLVLIGVSGLAGPTAYAQIGKPGVSTQISLGERAAADLRKQSKVLPETDPKVIELRKVGARLLSTFHDKEEWHFTFDVIDDKQINAFALPGGPTFFYTGLLDRIKTEDELAGVMGHELTHVRRQHWAHQYAASLNRSLLLNLGLILIHANNTATGIVSIGDQVIFDLPFSRGDEHQADDGGYDMMTAAGYNPIGMVHVFQMLQSAVKGERPPEWLNDHPSDKNRVKFLEGRIDKDTRSFPPEIPLPYPTIPKL